MVFQYDPQKTKALETPLEKIQLDPTQERLIRDLAAIVAPPIGLDPFPCHGLWLRAVRAWQVEHNRPATTISEMSPAMRARAAAQIRDHFVVLATQMLRSPDQGMPLAKAVQDAYDMYMAKYNQRR